jgi:hypothetical protein
VSGARRAWRPGAVRRIVRRRTGARFDGIGFSLAGLILCAALACLGPGRAAAAEDLAIAVEGPPETVFEWSKEACAKSHVPDVPARAFRSADGQVHLIASHHDNRALVGPSLDTVRAACPVLYQAGADPDLARYDDLSWISAVHTRDGRQVYALAHTEQRGHRTPGLCPAGSYSACLLNTITALVSDDGGRTFRKPDGPALVATLPYPFPTDREARVGYANPTNIIERDGWFYTLVFADGYRAQRRGPCLMRTRTLEDPASWRAFDGRDFTVAFVDPFRAPVADPRQHVCTPVAEGRIARSIGGLVEHRASGLVIAVFGDERKEPDGQPVAGIYSATSRDLIHWSEPRLVSALSLLWKKDCGKPQAFFYPALIDPAARTPSFEDIGDKGYLYLVRYNLSGCKVTWDRDLVRLPIRVVGAP